MHKPLFACCLAFAVIGLAARPASAQPEAVLEITDITPAADAFQQTGQEAPTKNFAVRLLIDVGHDYKNYFSKETALWLAIGGGAAAAVHPADENIKEWAVEKDVNPPFADTYGSQWLHIPVALAWWGIASAAGSSRHADAGRDLLRAQISVVSWTYAIKLVANRTRPNGDPHSFPSGHASTSFATAMVLQEHYGWKLGVPAFGIAAYTAFSRIMANQHWTSDVVMGAAVGMASGRTVTLHLRDTRMSLAPLAVPGGGGVMVSVLRPE
jgi:membrane-associated phospholipid phosphatase